MNKVLIADNVSDAVFKVFDENNIEYVQKTGLSEDELSREIVDYAGLVIRSAVTVTDKIISSAKNLRVIGRPGVKYLLPIMFLTLSLKYLMKITLNMFRKQVLVKTSFQEKS